MKRFGKVAAMLVMLVVLVLLVAADAFAQCPGGVCTRESTPIRQVLKKAEKSVLVARPFAEVKRARTTYQRTGRRFVLFRRALSR